ncbi:MAG: glycosyltransferase, partial [Vicinamibacterales bacterium]
ANARSGNLELRLAHGLAHDELPLFAAACDVILCTSETEGWPNSVKEALACNVPFVSTDVSDLPDIARLEPSCRISPPDPEAIAVALREALASTERPDLRKYVAGMTPDAASDHLMAVYTRAVSQHRRDSSNALASPIEA